MLTLADLLESLIRPRMGAIDALAALPIAHVVIDSREVVRGDLFVAFVGERTNGHQHVGHALGRGAIAALVQEDLDPATLAAAEAIWIDARYNAAPISVEALQGAGPERPVLIRVDSTEAALQRAAKFWRGRFPKLRVVGVTGSIGKTTTKELIAQVLSRRFVTLKSEGNLNNALGVPLTLLRLTDAHEVAVLEMGMDRLGEITRYCEWAQPQIGVVTRIAPVHLEKLGSMDNIVLAKSELILALPDDGVSILNDDDELVRGMRQLSRAKVMTAGLTPRADVWAGNVASHGLDGISLVLHVGEEAEIVHVPLLGAHSAQTAVMAAAVGLALGMSLEEVTEGLMVAPNAQLRLVVSKGPFDSLVIDDTYNASAESMIAALNVLEDIADPDPDAESGVAEVRMLRVAVLGDMLELGSAEQTAHEEVGCRAAMVADVVIAVGERARWIAQAAIECGLDRAQVRHVPDTATALATLRELVTRRSAILVKGSRGMQMEKIVAGLGGATE